MPSALLFWQAHTMGTTRRDWNRSRVLSLRGALGAFCRVCGDRDNLSFDCRAPRGSAHHALSSIQRVTFYIREARTGNLQLLCRACNSIKRGHNLAVFEAALRHVHGAAALITLRWCPRDNTTIPPEKLQQAFRVALELNLESKENGASNAPAPSVIKPLAPIE